MGVDRGKRLTAAAAAGGQVDVGSEGNRGAITTGIMIAMVMGAIDATVANIALPHIQRNLLASPEQITWVITSYIVAMAVATPLSGWLATRLGVKPMLLIAVAGFTLASLLCGMAGSLPELVLYRVLQGAMAAPIQPLAQTVLLNINPPERHSRAMALMQMATVGAPVVGPVLGAYLTDQLSWRWCFLINGPAGAAAVLLLWAYLPRETGRARPFDFIGFGSLAVGIAAFQLMLDRGPSVGWFVSRETWLYALLAAGAASIFVAHARRAKHPLFDASLVRDRNFVAASVVNFFVAAILFSSLTLLPLMMQGPLGYSVVAAGYLSTPRSIVMLLMLQVMGLIDAKVDRRLLIGVGLLFCAGALWQMSLFDLTTSRSTLVLATIILAIGQGVMLVPLVTVAFVTITPSLRPDASTANILLRNMGGAIGVSLVQAMLVFNSQRMHAALARPGGAGEAASGAALSTEPMSGVLALSDQVSRQAAMTAYGDAFQMLALVSLLALPLLFFLQPRSPTGAR